MKECDSSILYFILLCFYLYLCAFSILCVTLIDSCLFDRYGAYAYVYVRCVSHGNANDLLYTHASTINTCRFGNVGTQFL